MMARRKIRKRSLEGDESSKPVRGRPKNHRNNTDNKPVTPGKRTQNRSRKVVQASGNGSGESSLRHQRKQRSDRVRSTNRVNVDQDSIPNQVNSEDEEDVGKSNHYRANVVGFIETYTKMKSWGLNEMHVRAMSRTPFWALFRSYHRGLVIESYHKKYDSNVLQILRSFDHRELRFSIGNRLIHLTPGAITKIFGLPSNGTRIILNEKIMPEGHFFKRYFVERTAINLACVELALQEALKGSSDEDVKDVVRLICLHFMISLLFTNTNLTIGCYFVPWVEDVDRMADYNWAQAVFQFLHDSIEKKRRPSTVIGCAPLLLFWLCEITNSLGPIEGRAHMVPRFVRWDLNDLRTYLRNHNLNEMEPFPNAHRMFGLVEDLDDFTLEDEDIVPVARTTKKGECEAEIDDNEGISHSNGVGEYPENIPVHPIVAKDLVSEVYSEGEDNLEVDQHNDQINSRSLPNNSNREGAPPNNIERGDSITKGNGVLDQLPEVDLMEVPETPLNEIPITVTDKTKASSHGNLVQQVVTPELGKFNGDTNVSPSIRRSEYVDRVEFEYHEDGPYNDEVNYSVSLASLHNEGNNVSVDFGFGLDNQTEVNNCGAPFDNGSDVGTPKSSSNYIRKLEFDKDGLSIKYERSRSLVEIQESELQTLRASRDKLEGKLRIDSIHSLRLEHELDLEREKRMELQEEVNRLTTTNEKLKAESNENIIEQGILRMYATNLEQEIEKLKIAATPMPSFEILSQSTQDASNIMNSFFYLNVMSKLHDKEAAKVRDLENELAEAKARIKVNQENVDLYVAGKVEAIVSLRNKNQELEAKITDLRRTMESMRGASSRLAESGEKNKSRCLELTEELNALRKKMNDMQVMNDELVVHKQSLERDIARLLPTHHDIKKVPEPNSMVRDHKERERRPREFGNDFIKTDTARKRKTNNADTVVTAAEMKKCAVIIDVDSLVDTVEPSVRKKKTRQPLNINRNVVAKELSVPVFKKLVDLWPVTENGTYYWQDGNYVVTREDIEDLLREDKVANNVIDAFGRVLKTDCECRSMQPIESLIISSYAWEFFKRNDNYGLQVFLYDALLNNLNGARRIFVPLTHKEEEHFTLLYLDVYKGEWLHLDPLQPRREGDGDKCLSNARDMSNAIHKYLVDMKLAAPGILRSMTRPCVTTNNGVRRTHAKDINNDEAGSLSWIARTDLNFGFRAMRECPQQRSGSVDCGVVVMYYIRELICGRNLVQEFTPADMTHMRAYLVELFSSADGTIDPRKFIIEH